MSTSWPVDALRTRAAGRAAQSVYRLKGYLSLQKWHLREFQVPGHRYQVGPRPGTWNLGLGTSSYGGETVFPSCPATIWSEIWLAPVRIPESSAVRIAASSVRASGRATGTEHSTEDWPSEA